MRFLIFTGQGSQFVGMGKNLYDSFDSVKNIFRKADSSLGFKLSDFMFNAPESRLTLTKNAQPAILTISYAIYDLLKKETDFDFDITAGHSLGEYTALVAAESFSFEEAVYAVYKRGEFMQNAVKEGVGAMAAIITKKHDAVERLCKNISKENDSYCDIANYNAPNQVIVSGYKKGIDKISNAAQEESLGKVIPLNVSAPFHCNLMKPVETEMASIIDNMAINKPKKPVIENVYSDIIKDENSIKKYLIEQITKPVKWLQNVEKAVELGSDEFIELGPKNILSSMLKRVYRKSNINFVVDLKSYNDYKGKL